MKPIIKKQFNWSLITRIYTTNLEAKKTVEKQRGLFISHLLITCTQSRKKLEHCAQFWLKVQGKEDQTQKSAKKLLGSPEELDHRIQKTTEKRKDLLVHNWKIDIKSDKKSLYRYLRRRKVREMLDKLQNNIWPNMCTKAKENTLMMVFELGIK